MKRLFDLSTAMISLILLIPIISLIAVLIRINLGRGVFFVQDRPGLNGELFKMIKFRTMKNLRDSDGALISDDKRMTKFGTILRQTSLDELPELINVLKGDMSLVGPRPLLVEYLPLYNQEQIRRHDLRPGLTGWAQVNGRNSISWEEKFKLDIWYVDNQSFWLDIKILFLTVKKVFVREGISAEGEATMSKFTGNKS